MIVRRATLQDDYKEIVHWWKDQGRAILSWEILPTLSFLAEDEQGKIACTWLYCSDSVTGFVAWSTINPAANKRSVTKALKLIQESVAFAAKAAGLKILFQFSGGGGFTRLLVRSGWTNTVVQHDFLMKEIS